MICATPAATVHRIDRRTTALADLVVQHQTPAVWWPVLIATQIMSPELSAAEIFERYHVGPIERALEDLQTARAAA